MLEIRNLETGYEKKQVLFDISLEVSAGEIIGIIGPNGAGKSTILKAVSGIIPIWKGDISFTGNSIKKNSIAENIRSGLTYAPQGNRVFDELTVTDNLELGGYLLNKKELKDRIEQVVEVFPILIKRSKQIAGKLSGGEQQMLALARALISKPKLLLLDEPSLGLAPNLLNDIFDKFVELNKTFSISMLIVEQKVNKILDISDRIYSIKLGKIAFDGNPKELVGNKEKLKELFL